METVIIKKEEYDNLVDALVMLTCLENAGVDNWSGYEYAMELYAESFDE